MTQYLVTLTDPRRPDVPLKVVADFAYPPTPGFLFSMPVSGTECEITAVHPMNLYLVQRDPRRTSWDEVHSAVVAAEDTGSARSVLVAAQESSVISGGQAPESWLRTDTTVTLLGVADAARYTVPAVILADVIPG